MALPVGGVEIAERLGVKPSVVSMWFYRSKRGEMRPPMPAPRWTVSGMPAWEWAEIRKWAEKTGRL